MRRYIFSCLAIFATLSLQAQTEDVTVFTSGTEGHKSYRIPAIVNLPDGKLLAFAEGRVGGSGDYGDVNIVLKTSTDQGKTWTALQTVVDYNTLQAGNPAPVVDLTDPAYPKGRIFLFYNTGNNHEAEVRKGNGLREAWYVSSTDGGLNWSEPVNITTQVHRPKQEKINPAYNFKEDWRAYANTPGHALQFKAGKYKGRIYIPANHSDGVNPGRGEGYFAHGYYSDDHGKTFKISETISIQGGNEATAAELSNGGLIFNARNQDRDEKARIVAYSKDGGASWVSEKSDQNLPDPVCQGSILDIGKKKGKNILAFSNLDHLKDRDNLTLRISYDEGKTWPWKKVIAKSSKANEGDFAAYSDLVNVNADEIGILYEKNNYSKIVFTVVNWKK